MRRVAAVQSVELSISDNTQLGALESVIVRGIPEVTVTRFSGTPTPGALGWEDVLVLTFGGISALADTIEVVRAYLETRGEPRDAIEAGGTPAGVTITAAKSGKRGSKSLRVQNATDAQVREFLDWYKE
jgi:hypothetical protein